MSTIERIEISCDVRECRAAHVVDPVGENGVALVGIADIGWIYGDLDLCPEHASASGIIAAQRDERPAPPAAPTAGTTSTEGITLALSADLAVWVASALERAGGRHDPRGLRIIRELHAQIEDYARSQP